jgi:hypothetical protein
LLIECPQRAEDLSRFSLPFRVRGYARYARYARSPRCSFFSSTATKLVDTSTENLLRTVYTCQKNCAARTWNLLYQCVTHGPRQCVPHGPCTVYPQKLCDTCPFTVAPTTQIKFSTLAPGYHLY